MKVLIASGSGVREYSLMDMRDRDIGQIFGILKDRSLTFNIVDFCVLINSNSMKEARSAIGSRGSLVRPDEFLENEVVHCYGKSHAVIILFLEIKARLLCRDCNDRAEGIVLYPFAREYTSLCKCHYNIFLLHRCMSGVDVQKF